MVDITPNKSAFVSKYSLYFEISFGRCSCLISDPYLLRITKTTKSACFPILEKYTVENECMCVCVYVCAYIYIYTYILTYTRINQ